MSTVKRPFTTMQRVSQACARWAFRVVRVSIAWIVVMLCLAVVLVRVSIAGASDVGLRFGDELMRVGTHHGNGDVDTDVYTIRMNGQVFQSANAATMRSKEEVLDYFQEQCRHHAGGLRDTFGNLTPALETLAPTTGTDGAMTVRRDSGDHGYVFCVAPDHALTTTERLERLHVLAKTSDLHDVGDMRYVSVKKTPEGTQVVTAWTEGPFVLTNLFNATGDALGEDFGNVPRPDAARRTFSGTIDGAPFGVNMYEVRGEVPGVLNGLDAKLVSAGWRRLKAGKEAPDNGRFYSLGNTMDLILSVDSVGDKLTQATYVVSRNTDPLPM